MNIAFLPKVRSDALMASANGEACSVRLPGVCNHNPRTTVLGHLPGIGKGVGTKVSDVHGAFVCSACHDALDRHQYERHGITDAMALDAMLRGHCETQAKWVRDGLLIVPGAKVV